MESISLNIEIDSTTETNLFQRSIAYLLNHTFIVADKQKPSQEIYQFLSVNDNFIKLKNYLRILGLELVKKESNGIICIQSIIEEESTNKTSILRENQIHFNQIERILILIFLFIYRKEYVLQNQKVIKTSYERILNEVKEIDPKFTDTHGFKNALKSLKKYNLIDCDEACLLKDDVILIYPSINMVWDENELKELLENSLKHVKRLHLKKYLSDEPNLEHDN